MRNVIKAEWYKLHHDILIWIVPLYYIFVGCYSTTYYHEIMNYRKGLELFGMPDVAWIQVAFAAVIVSGYVIGGDFSRRTIQNALAVGISKKSYYFARLLVQMEFTAGMFGIALLLHTVGRLVHPRGNSQVVIDFLWRKMRLISSDYQYLKMEPSQRAEELLPLVIENEDLLIHALCG